MIEGARSHLRRVRDDLTIDFNPLLTSKLWNAEKELDKALAQLHPTDVQSAP